MLSQDHILNFIISEDESLVIPDDVRASEDFQEYKKIWDMCDVLAEPERSGDLEDAWSSISSWMESEESQPQQVSDETLSPSVSGRVVMLKSERWAIAASFLLVIGSALYLLRPQDPYTTALASEGTEVRLPDGSTAELSNDAQIKFLKEETFMTGDDRVVYLEGEAIFDVVSDASKPFKVVTNATTVDVLGTIFRFKAEGEYSESENVEGLVNFSVNEDPTIAQILNPGDKASYEGDGITYTPAAPPPPPPIPRNKVQILDLIDILTDRYPENLEVSNQFRSNNTVVEVDLRGDLIMILEDLRSNENLQIEMYSGQGNGHFVLTRITGEGTSLRSDYSYEHYLSGVPLKGNED